MTLVELAKRWVENDLTTEEFTEAAKNIIVWVPPTLTDESDEDLQISIDGNSWLEVYEDVFDCNNDIFDAFREDFHDALVA